jgi:hypothetical protein
MYGVQATLASANQEQPERAATWVNVLVAAGRADVAAYVDPVIVTVVSLAFSGSRSS